MDKTGYQKYQLGQTNKAKQIRYTVKEEKEGLIISPMPGRITKVLVKKEDRVQEGEILAIVEAMKMENEILAPKSGIIREVKIVQGQNVLSKDILFVLMKEEKG